MIKIVKEKALTMRIDGELLTEINKLVKDLGISRSEFVRDLLIKELAEQGIEVYQFMK